MIVLTLGFSCFVLTRSEEALKLRLTVNGLMWINRWLIKLRPFLPPFYPHESMAGIICNYTQEGIRQLVQASLKSRSLRSNARGLLPCPRPVQCCILVNFHHPKLAGKCRKTGESNRVAILSSFPVLEKVEETLLGEAPTPHHFD